MYDEPYIRFEGLDTQQETFFIEDPNYNMLEIKSIQGSDYNNIRGQGELFGWRNRL